MSYQLHTLCQYWHIRSTIRYVSIGTHVAPYAMSVPYATSVPGIAYHHALCQYRGSHSIRVGA
eukprot:2813201-Rhodomonas_salina.2